MILGKGFSGHFFPTKLLGLVKPFFHQTFLQFLIFFERVGNASRIYNLQNLKLSAVNERKRGRFQVLKGEAQIQAYRYNPEFKVDRGFEKKVE